LPNFVKSVRTVQPEQLNAAEEEVEEEEEDEKHE